MRLLRESYKPLHGENRMRYEGDVRKARESFLTCSSSNLKFLIENRFIWMNDYIGESDTGLEVGSGTAISKFFIRAKSFITTDFCQNEWLDKKNIDALATPFSNESFHFIVASNMLHHVPYPMRFLREMHRILKKDGFLLIQDINASFFMRMVLRLMKHEGYSYEPDVFNESTVCTDPCDLWSANCAIPNLLFDDKSKFKKNVPYFKIMRHDFSEFFVFLNSGGVIAKTFFIPLPLSLCKFLKSVDDILTKILPNIFALQTRIILQKT